MHRGTEQGDREQKLPSAVTSAGAKRGAGVHCTVTPSIDLDTGYPLRGFRDDKIVQALAGLGAQLIEIARKSRLHAKRLQCRERRA